MREEFEEEEMRGDEFDDLFKFSMERKWQQAIEIYKQNPKSHKTKLTNSEETALHVAISSFNPRIPKHATYIEQMIDLMDAEGSLLEALSMQNERGDTALHIAAAVGSPYICGCIASRPSASAMPVARRPCLSRLTTATCRLSSASTTSPTSNNPTLSVEPRTEIPSCTPPFPANISVMHSRLIT